MREGHVKSARRHSGNNCFYFDRSSPIPTIFFTLQETNSCMLCSLVLKHTQAKKHPVHTIVVHVHPVASTTILLSSESVHAPLHQLHQDKLETTKSTNKISSLLTMAGSIGGRNGPDLLLCLCVETQPTDFIETFEDEGGLEVASWDSGRPPLCRCVVWILAFLHRSAGSLAFAFVSCCQRHKDYTGQAAVKAAGNNPHKQP